ncbi:hypothetical protein XENOCAPTIV_004254 [Xenoophorus captivus]|uniref:VWFA domain-containing protein n=1 Tax=Xenoophorus captivus TaxID=1517983 RepID=A0ABV0R305_9TELE
MCFEVPKCPIGMQYSECTKPCSTTCHSLNIQEVCKEECVDGCTCPTGKVLDGNRCVEVSQCSCTHMGRHFPPGSTISQDCNTCAVEARYMRPVGVHVSELAALSLVLSLVVRGRGCVRRAVSNVIRVKRGWSVPGPARIWTCHVSVLPASLAASVHKAQVLVENEACGIVGHRCAKAFTIFYQGGLIVMQDGEVDAEPYVEMCVEAACSCSSVGDCSCFCDVIAAYAQACSEKDVSVMWRSNDLCPNVFFSYKSHCENNTPSCEDCTSLSMFSTPTPTPSYGTFTTLPFTTLMPTGMCDRAMDLAFLLDGSQALTEDEFLASKEFIFRVVERFRMGSAHTRATVLLYHSGVKTYDLQVQKRLFKKILHDLHYTGGHAGFLDEAVKYLAINIYDKNKREHAGRVAIILTASGNPRPVRAIVKMLRKKAITTLTVALGPGVNMGQINDITKANPDNRAYVLSSTGELPDRLLEVTDYLCTLGMEPEVPKPPGLKPTPGRARKVSPITSPATYVETKPTLLPSTPASTPSSGLSLVTTVPPYHPPATEVTFIIEGSDAVGEANFTKSLIFVEEVISQLTEEEEFIRITVIQYSVTVTVEINRWELRQQRDHLLQRLREIRWRGGSKTNTGEAVTMTLQEMTTIPPPHGPTPPQLVFLVTENPPTDTVTRPPTTSTKTRVYPIGVGPKVHETDLVQFSHPQRPMMVEDYNHLTSLVHRVVNITQTTVRPRYPTLPPLIIPTHSTLPLTGCYINCLIFMFLSNSSP